MMEFFVSKFWAFLVSIVIMGVLVQGIQFDSRSDQGEAMNDMAGDLENLFREFVAAGVGLETTVHLDRMLPSTATLTVFKGYGLLEDAGGEVRFAIPIYQMWMETEQGERLEMDRLVLGPTDVLRLFNDSEGPKMIALSP
ncbi:MAG: hypothetical protein AB9819_03110 [Methanomassiliicoccales archaeon]